jgi:hypothetical protein
MDRTFSHLLVSDGLLTSPSVYAAVKKISHLPETPCDKLQPLTVCSGKRTGQEKIPEAFQVE